MSKILATGLIDSLSKCNCNKNAADSEESILLILITYKYIYIYTYLFIYFAATVRLVYCVVIAKQSLLFSYHYVRLL